VGEKKKKKETHPNGVDSLLEQTEHEADHLLALGPSSDAEFAFAPISFRDGGGYNGIIRKWHLGRIPASKKKKKKEKNKRFSESLNCIGR
jgi:hypothetical protein